MYLLGGAHQHGERGLFTAPVDRCQVDRCVAQTQDASLRVFDQPELGRAKKRRPQCPLAGRGVGARSASITEPVNLFKRSPYRGTSLIRNSAPLGPYHRLMPRVLQRSQGSGRFSMSEVTLNSVRAGAPRPCAPSESVHDLSIFNEVSKQGHPALKFKCPSMVEVRKPSSTCMATSLIRSTHPPRITIGL